MTEASVIPGARTARLRSYDGTEIAYYIVGDGYPVCVSSPLGIHPSFWSPVVERLKHRYRFVFWQNRGLWGSALPADRANVSVEAHARDLAAVVEATGLRRYALVGYCGGVAPAMESLPLLSRLPERALLASASYRPAAITSSLRKLVGQLGTGGRGVRKLRATCVGMCPGPLRTHLSEALEDDRRLAALLAGVAAIYEYRYSLTFSERIPFAFVTAEYDEADVHTSTRELLSRLDTARVTHEELQGVGHFFFFDAPDVGAAVIDKFLNGVAA